MQVASGGDMFSSLFHRDVGVHRSARQRGPQLYISTGGHSRRVNCVHCVHPCAKSICQVAWTRPTSHDNTNTTDEVGTTTPQTSMYTHDKLAAYKMRYKQRVKNDSSGRIRLSLGASTIVLNDARVTKGSIRAKKWVLQAVGPVARLRG